MNYTSIYYKITKRAQERASTKEEANKILGYSEGHHIFPRCMGGGDEPENIAHLTAAEHYVVHQLLIKMYPRHPGMLAAIVWFSSSKDGEIKNNKLYSWIKKKISEERKGKNKHNDERYRKSSETQKGRSKETYEPLRIMSEKRTGRTKENDESVKGMATKLTGRTKDTHPHLAVVGKKVSIALTGRTKENNEAVRKMAEKKKGRTKENDESIRKMADKLTGRTKETHEYLEQLSIKRNKLSKEQREEIIRMRNENVSIKNILNHIIVEYKVEMAYSSVAALLKRENKDYKRIRADVF